MMTFMGRQALTPQDLAEEKSRIAVAARELFEQGGADAVTLRAISKSLGCSPMQPYRYFPDGKAEILAAVRTQAFDRFSEWLEDIPARTSDDIGLLEAYCEAYVQFALDDPASFRLMFGQELSSEASEDDYPELAAAVARVRAPVIDVINRVVVTRHAGVDPRKIGQVLWASAHGLVMLHLAGHLQYGERIENLVPVMIATLREGLLAQTSD